MTCVILFVRLKIANHYCGLPISSYIKSVLLKPIVVICMSLIVPLYWSFSFGEGNGLIPIITTTVVCVICVGVTVFFVGLDKSERFLVVNFIKKYIKK